MGKPDYGNLISQSQKETCDDHEANGNGELGKSSAFSDEDIEELDFDEFSEFQQAGNPED